MRKMLPLWKKILYILSWIIVLPVYALLVLMGLFIVPIGLLLRSWEGTRRSTFWPELFWLWGNDEDQYSPHWHGDTWWKDFIWLAIRNPVGNFKFLFKDREANWSGNWVSPVMEAQELLDNNTSYAYRWAYNGLFAGFRIVWMNDYKDMPMRDHTVKSFAESYNEFWIGWKVGSAVPGMGFTLQLRLKREIGK